jgi:hypothetical protein
MLTGAYAGESKLCSVFDLEAHPDFSFRMGDVVLRLDPGILLFTCFTGTKEAHPDFSFRMGDVVLRLDPGIPLRKKNLRRKTLRKKTDLPLKRLPFRLQLQDGGCSAASRPRYSSVYLLYWYKRTNTDADNITRRGSGRSGATDMYAYVYIHIYRGRDAVRKCCDYIHIYIHIYRRGSGRSGATDMYAYVYIHIYIGRDAVCKWCDYIHIYIHIYRRGSGRSGATDMYAYVYIHIYI